MSSEEYTALNKRLDNIELYARLNAKPILDIKEASLFTGFSVGHLYRLTSQRLIPHFKKNQKLLFKKSELESWLLENKVMTENELNQKATTYTVTHKSNRR